MVSVNGIAGNDNEDAGNQKYAVYRGPPCEGGKFIERVGGLYLSYDAGDKGDEPRQLSAG